MEYSSVCVKRIDQFVDKVPFRAMQIIKRGIFALLDLLGNLVKGHRRRKDCSVKIDELVFAHQLLLEKREGLVKSCL